jgi:hypothetical protein
MDAIGLKQTCINKFILNTFSKDGFEIKVPT